MSKKLFIIFKILGVIFLILGATSIVGAIIINLFNDDLANFIIKLILNLGYIILGLICFLSNSVEKLNKSTNIMILLNGLIFLYTGVSQYVGGNSIRTQEDTMLPGLNALGGTLSMLSGILYLGLSLTFIVISILGLKRLKVSSIASIIIAIILIGVYIFLKIKLNFGLISLNMILLFITLAISSNLVRCKDIKKV